MPMALGLGVGLSFTQNGRSQSVEDVLCEAIANNVLITAKFDGAFIMFAPLVLYVRVGVLYVDGLLETDLPAHGNKPPTVASWEVSELSAASPSQTTFTVHPRLVPVLRRYQNVKCIVSTV